MQGCDNIFCLNATIFVDFGYDRYLMLSLFKFLQEKYYLEIGNVGLIPSFIIFLCRNLNELSIKYQS